MLGHSTNKFSTSKRAAHTAPAGKLHQAKENVVIEQAECRVVQRAELEHHRKPALMATIVAEVARTHRQASHHTLSCAPMHTQKEWCGPANSAPI